MRGELLWPTSGLKFFRSFSVAVNFFAVFNNNELRFVVSGQLVDVANVRGFRGFHGFAHCVRQWKKEPSVTAGHCRLIVFHMFYSEKLFADAKKVFAVFLVSKIFMSDIRNFWLFSAAFRWFDHEFFPLRWFLRFREFLVEKVVCRQTADKDLTNSSGTWEGAVSDF